MKAFPYLILLMMAAILTGGCARPTGFRSAYDERQLSTPEFRATTLGELREIVAANSEHHGELWTKMGVTARRNGDRLAPSFTTIAIYREPDLIKLGISRMELGTLYTILITGNQVALFANREGRMFTGTLDDLANQTALLGGLSPRDLVSALLIQSELADVLANEDAITIKNKGRHFLVARRHPVSGRQYFWLVRKTDCLTEELLVRTPGGREELRIRYLEYELVENEKNGTENPYPSRLVFQIPSERLGVEIHVKEYRLAPELPDGIEKLPKAREYYDLKDLAFEDAP